MRIRDVKMCLYPVRDYGKAKALPVSIGVGPIRDNGNTKVFPISNGVTGSMPHRKTIEIKQGFLYVAMKIKEKTYRKEVDECNEDTLSKALTGLRPRRMGMVKVEVEAEK